MHLFSHQTTMILFFLKLHLGSICLWRWLEPTSTCKFTACFLRVCEFIRRPPSASPMILLTPPPNVAVEFAVKQDIMRLLSYRNAGIRRLRLGRLYDYMNTRRQCEKQQRHLLTDMLNNLQVRPMSIGGLS